MISRTTDKLQSSYRVYELVLGSINGSRYVDKHIGDLKKASDQLNRDELAFYSNLSRRFSEKVPEVFKQILSKLHGSLTARCRELIEFTGYPATETRDHCVIDPRALLQGPVQNGWMKKEMSCPDWYENPDAIMQNLLVIYGRFDVLLPIVMPHAYWSNVFRKELAINHPVFGDFISIPTSRIKHTWNNENNHSMDVENVDFHPDTSRPFVLWTFIKMPMPDHDCVSDPQAKCERNRNRDDRCKTKSQVLLEVVNRILGNGDSGGSIRERFEGSRLEAFLSFSTHYQVIVKGEFTDHEEIERYLTELRALRDVDSTASIIGIKNTVLMDDSAKITPIIKKTHGSCECEIFRIGLLLKTTAGQESSVQKALYEDLLVVLQPETPDVTFCNRGYYWDMLVIIKTNKQKEITQYVIDELSEQKLGQIGKVTLPKDALRGIITIPFWTIDTPGCRCWTSQENPKEHTTPECGTSPCPSATPSGIHDRMIRKARDVDQLYSAFQMNFIKRRDGSCPIPMSDLLVRRYYYLKFDIEWLYSLAQQTYHAWNFHLKRGHETFFRMNRLFELIFSVMKEAGMSIQSRLQSGKHDANTDIFEKLSQVNLCMTCIRRSLYCMRFEYHTKMEGLRAVTMTDPHIVFGERSGVTDIFMDAISVLLEKYANRWKKNTEDGDEAFERLWDGLTVTSNDPQVDYWIHPETQIIAVPLEFKSHIHRRLLPLAHEASHQIINDIYFSPRYKKEDPIRSEFESILDTIRERCLHMATEMHYTLRETLGAMDTIIQRLVNLISALMNEHRGNILIAQQEMMTDALTYLGAGPAYMNNLGDLEFRSPGVFGLNHLPVFLRIFIGKCLMRRWDVESDPWSDAVPYGDQSNPAPSIWEAMEALEMEAGRKIQPICQFLESARIPDPSAVLGLLASYRNQPNPLCDLQVFLATALIDSKGYLFRRLALWCKKYSSDFLFYPIDDVGFVRHEGVVQVHRICQETAERMLFGEEIIMDRDVRHIAAAALLPIFKRPVVPCGRIIHSLYYAS